MEYEDVEIDHMSFLAGAEMMRLAVWNKLAPILEEAEFGDDSIANIFADVGLLHEVCDSNIDTLKDQALDQFFKQQVTKHAEPNS